MCHMFSVTEGLKNSEIKKKKIACLISIDGGQTSDSSLPALFGLLGVSKSLMNINETHENYFPVNEVPFWHTLMGEQQAHICVSGELNHL